VPPLHAAVALVQVHDVAVRIRKHLKAADSHHYTAAELVRLSAAFALSPAGLCSSWSGTFEPQRSATPLADAHSCVTALLQWSWRTGPPLRQQAAMSYQQGLTCSLPVHDKYRACGTQGTR
jgi:hypothetical protein